MAVDNNEVYMDLSEAFNLMNYEDYTLKSRIEIFRELSASGFGNVEMLKSRYKRNTDGFADIFNSWRNGEKVEEPNYTTMPDPSLSFEEKLRNRKNDYEQRKAEVEYQLRRRIFNIPHDWACIVSFSDLHLDDNFSNVPYLFEIVKMFNKYPQVRFANLNDINNWWTGAWAQSMALNSNYTPENGFNDFIELLKLMGDKLLVHVNGNHDFFATKSAGFDFVKPIVLNYSPGCAYSDNNVTAKFVCNTAESDWIRFAHQFKGGRSQMNPHAQNIKHLRFQAPHDVNYAVTGHYHHPQASYGEFIFDNKVCKSLLLGSIKGYDEYAGSLGFEMKESREIFGFTFIYNGIQRTITNVREAMLEIESHLATH